MYVFWEEKVEKEGKPGKSSFSEAEEKDFWKTGHKY